MKLRVRHWNDLAKQMNKFCRLEDYVGKTSPYFTCQEEPELPLATDEDVFKKSWVVNLVNLANIFFPENEFDSSILDKPMKGDFFLKLYAIARDCRDCCENPTCGMDGTIIDLGNAMENINGMHLGCSGLFGMYVRVERRIHDYVTGWGNWYGCFDSSIPCDGNMPDYGEWEPRSVWGPSEDLQFRAKPYKGMPFSCCDP